MEVRARHLLMGLALTCAGLAVAYLPPAPGSFRFPWQDLFSPERNFARRIESTLRSELEALALLERRDSALQHLEQMGNGRWLYVDPSLPAALDSAIREQAADDPPFDRRAPGTRTAAAVFLDTVRNRHGIYVSPPIYGPRNRHLLPAATDGATCLTVSTIGPVTVGRIVDSTRTEPVRSPYSPRSLFGPCDFVAAFGVPSPSIDEWMRRGALEPDDALRSRCLDGDDRACELLFVRSDQTVRSPYGPQVFSISGEGLVGRLPRFNRVDRAFLTAVLDSIGPQRFQDFWTDPDPVPRSFERHTGKSAGEWFRADARPPRASNPTHVAVTVPLGVWLQAGLLIALCAGVAVMVVGRREVR
jgi:hypothetical protein